jgi:hypothetical protein
MRGHTKLLLVSLLPGLGCASAQEGRLYRHDSPAVTRFYVASSLATTADVRAQLFDGTTCEGRLARTVSSTPALAGDESGELDSAAPTAVAILVCRSNDVLRCRLVHQLVEGYVFGRCEDQHGVKYTVIF